jgi:hypothetical protein
MSETNANNIIISILDNRKGSYSLSLDRLLRLFYKTTCPFEYRALKWSASFPLLSLSSLGVKLLLLFISELLKVVSTGVGVLFTVPPDSLCNRSNRDVSLLDAGCETFSSVLLDRRLRDGQSAVKRSSEGGSLRFFSFLIFLSFAAFFFFGLIHL